MADQIKQTDLADIRGPVARGWCHDKNREKEMDVDLAEAISKEVAAELSQAVEAAQNQYVYTAAQMESERFKSKVEGSNEVLLAVLYELGYTPPEDEAIGLGRVKRELNRKLEEAQGAILEAASNHRFIENADFMGCACGEAFAYQSDWRIHLRRVLQTEPMTAALAARDKQSQKWPSSVPGGEEPNYPPPVMEAGGNSLTYRGFRWKRVMPETEAARKETL